MYLCCEDSLLLIYGLHIKFNQVNYKNFASEKSFHPSVVPMEEQCRVHDILMQLMGSRQLICLMLFVEGIRMLSMGSFIFTQQNGVLSPWRKGTHCFHLCDAPSTALVLSIILNKLVSGWVARDRKILFCCLFICCNFWGWDNFWHCLQPGSSQKIRCKSTSAQAH